MVANYRETSDILRRDPRYIAGAEQMNALAVRLKDKGLLPGRIEKHPSIASQAEWDKQSQKLAGLFAKELGFKTPEAYIESLPKFESQPEQFKNRFDIPVIVETRVPLKRMLELAGIVTYFDADSVKDWEKSKFKSPKTPYTTWLNDGASNLNKSVDTVRKSLRPDEKGANIYEAIALYLKDPKILEKHYLDVPGSRVGPGDAPSLVLWDGRPGLGHGWTDVAGPRYGSVVAGKL